MAVRSSLKQLEKMPGWTHVKRDGLAITVERRGTSSRIALRHLSCPWHHVQSAKDHTGEETALWGIGPRGCTLRTLRTEGAWGSPQTPILIMPEEPQVLITVGANQSIFFWTLGQLSLCTLKPLVCFLPIHYHNGTVWMSLTLLFQPSIKLQLGLCAFFFFFFLVSNHARVSLTPSGEGCTKQGPVLSFHEYGTCSF